MSTPVHTVGAIAVLWQQTVSAARRNGISSRGCLEQLYDIGNRTLPLVVVGLGFFGMVIVTIAYEQARKYVGNVAVVGPAYFELLVREMGPLTVALLAASKIGAATSAELASMSVNEQLDAMQLSATDPLSELVAPRVVASVIALPCLTVLGTLSATVTASLTVTWVFGSDGMSFFDARYVDWADIACATLKAVLAGALIPLAVSVRALKARAGAAAVGDAVTSGVVDASMLVLVVDFIVAFGFLVIDR